VRAPALPLDQPHALGHELRVGRPYPAAETGLGVERAGHPPLGRGALRGHHPDLPRERHRVGERVVALDQAVAHRDQVEAFELDPLARRRDARKALGAREGAGQAPLHAAAFAFGRRGDDLHVQVGDRVNQASDERAHAVRGEGVDLSAHVLVAPVGPQRQDRLEIALIDRLEVPARDGLGLAARDAFAFAGHLLNAGGRLLHLGARLTCAIRLGHPSSFTPVKASSLVCPAWRR
jgi:hypothetical protein